MGWLDEMTIKFAEPIRVMQCRRLMWDDGNHGSRRTAEEQLMSADVDIVTTSRKGDGKGERERKKERKGRESGEGDG